ncbi:MAG: methyltransferase domain-containing protein [Pseudonocardia sp.]|uniref:methyltransferase domain-containing protein n=1 Tax=unclassified Pseudonocardia TaxID=2619320 RepID=UPI00086F0B5B|nr:MULTISPECIES: methyltransferase domain-containing protein [unclassified Pseudonocardia]MBN9110295.1 methyltransferase domain-containing protein [Pseudonocardia sp.]ODU12317.1 MAG: protein-L-isoaspartate(D-aspartate) O-methyltransferase [Pseudonocardia sp. SCN 72-51]ODV06419.1 MAG: protein-L-isoaspartate(D-aspartate) O-methyltransferase [Pseudonocardia sp. SCN 73-27]
MASAQEARARMVDALRRDGRVRSDAVARAMGAIPRHVFLPGSTVETAYADTAVVTKVVDGVALSSASQPSMVAIMLEQLDLHPGQRVLEIGAGTGYNAALMAQLVGAAGEVTSVDIDEDIVVAAAEHLVAAGCPDVVLVTGDGALGYPAGAPYDRVVLTVGAADLRPEWVAQLATGGRLLLPLRVRGSQLSVALDLGADGVLRSASVRSCAFIRLRGAGAGEEQVVAIDGRGWWAEPAEPGAPLPNATSMRAALDRPGAEMQLGVRLSVADVWDGLGLWIALAEPTAFRLLARDAAAGSAVAAELVEIGGARATIAVPGVGGFVALVQDEHGGPARIRCHGDVAPGVGARVAALVEAWVTAERPHSADLQLTAFPREQSTSAAAGGRVVGLASATLLVEYPRARVG